MLGLHSSTHAKSLVPPFNNDNHHHHCHRHGDDDINGIYNYELLQSEEAGLKYYPIVSYGQECYEHYFDLVIVVVFSAINQSSWCWGLHIA